MRCIGLVLLVLLLVLFVCYGTTNRPQVPCQLAANLRWLTIAPLTSFELALDNCTAPTTIVVVADAMDLLITNCFFQSVTLSFVGGGPFSSIRIQNCTLGNDGVAFLPLLRVEPLTFTNVLVELTNVRSPHTFSDGVAILSTTMENVTMRFRLVKFNCSDSILRDSLGLSTLRNVSFEYYGVEATLRRQQVPSGKGSQAIFFTASDSHDIHFIFINCTMSVFTAAQDVSEQGILVLRVAKGATVLNGSLIVLNSSFVGAALVTNTFGFYIAGNGHGTVISKFTVLIQEVTWVGSCAAQPALFRTYSCNLYDSSFRFSNITATQTTEYGPSMSATTRRCDLISIYTGTVERCSFLVSHVFNNISSIGGNLPNEKPPLDSVGGALLVLFNTSNTRATVEHCIVMQHFQDKDELDNAMRVTTVFGIFVLNVEPEPLNTLSNTTIVVRDVHMEVFVLVRSDTLLSVFSIALVALNAYQFNTTVDVTNCSLVLVRPIETIGNPPAAIFFGALTFVALKKVSIEGSSIQIRGNSLTYAVTLVSPPNVCQEFAAVVNLPNTVTNTAIAISQPLSSNLSGAVVCVEMDLTFTSPNCDISGSSILLEQIPSGSEGNLTLSRPLGRYGGLLTTVSSGAFVLTATKITVTNVAIESWVRVGYLSGYVFGGNIQVGSRCAFYFSSNNVFRGFRSVFEPTNTTTKWLLPRGTDQLPSIVMSGCSNLFAFETQGGAVLQRLSFRLVGLPETFSRGNLRSVVRLDTRCPPIIPFFSPTVSPICAHVDVVSSMSPSTLLATLQSGYVCVTLSFSREMISHAAAAVRGMPLAQFVVHSSWGSVRIVDRLGPSAVRLYVTVAPSQVSRVASPSVDFVVAVNLTYFVGCERLLRWDEQSLNVPLSITNVRSVMSTTLGGKAQTATVASATAAALSFSSAFGGVLSRNNVLMQLAACTNTDTDPLEFYDSPSNMVIGTGTGAYLRGAVVGNALLMYGCSAALYVIVVFFNVYSARREINSRIQGRILRDALTAAHLPSASMIFLATWLQPTLSSSIGLFAVDASVLITLESASDEQVLVLSSTSHAVNVCIGVVGIICTVAPTIFFCWRLWTWFPCFASRQPFNAHKFVVNGREPQAGPTSWVSDTGVYATIRRAMKWVMHEDVEWRPIRDVHCDDVSKDASERFLKRYSELFAPYRVRPQLSFSVDVAILVLFGVVGGIRPATTAGCRVLTYVTIALNCLPVAYFAAFRPQITVLERVFTVVSNVLQILGGVLIATEIIDLALLVVLIQSYVTLGVIAVQWIWFFRRRIRGLATSLKGRDGGSRETEGACQLSIAASVSVVGQPPALSDCLASLLSRATSDGKSVAAANREEALAVLVTEICNF